MCDVIAAVQHAGSLDAATNQIVANRSCLPASPRWEGSPSVP